MNRAVIVVPTIRPRTGDAPTRIAPAEPVKPSSERACTAKAMLRITTNRLTTPDTMPTTRPAASAFWANS